MFEQCAEWQGQSGADKAIRRRVAIVKIASSQLLVLHEIGDDKAEIELVDRRLQQRRSLDNNGKAYNATLAS